MRWNGASTRARWWALPAAAVAVAAALAGRTLIDAWLFGALLIIAWGLLAYGLSVLRVAKGLWLLLTASLLVLALVVWNYTAPQPRIQLGGLRLQKLPSSISPGVVELVILNSGSVPAHVVGAAVAELGPRFGTVGALAPGGVQSELSQRLARADQWPAAGTMAIAAGQTARVEIDIPPSERSWFIARGQATVLVTARLRYRDRVFRREEVFCLFANPPSATWSPCPF